MVLRSAGAQERESGPSGTENGLSDRHSMEEKPIMMESIRQFFMANMAETGH